MPVEITVLGVASDCLSDGCLANERWDCYFSYAGPGPGDPGIETQGSRRNPEKEGRR